MSLNLNPEPASRLKNKSYKKALRVSGAISLLGVGSTFAANITLNGDQNVEFGQGVAQTLSCDDQVNINPVSYYDNTSGTFLLDYVEVSGINLIPVGAISGSYDSSSQTYAEYADSTAMAAHPGQYYDSDTSAWTNTCDQVVLDFKAFTDQTKYSTNTLDGYDILWDDPTATPNTISSPLLWFVHENDGIVKGVSGHGSGPTSAMVPNVAIVFDAQNEASNKGTLEVQSGAWNILERLRPDFSGTGYVKESTFQIFANQGHHAHQIWNNSNDGNDPTAGAISKITVESMRYFPTDYQTYNSYSGALGKKPS